jgi:hypothetical protein
MKHDEFDKAARDNLLYGISIMRDGKRVDPRAFYIAPPWWKRLWRWLRSLLSEGTDT